MREYEVSSRLIDAGRYDAEASPAKEEEGTSFFALV